MNPAPKNLPGQRGAITIVVALMLLVLLTIAALGMSRNSVRDIMITATARQAAMARNEADTGLDWAIYWLAPANQDTGGNSGAPGSVQFTATIQNLITNTASAGVKTSLSKVTTSTTGGHSEAFALDVTRMGKLESPGNDQKLVTDWRLWPDIWAIRSNATVDYGNGLTYVHAKEAWLTTPVRP
ncbi:hypothetical protein [Mesoterricola silvestris]|uniref:Type 4 fimbrial biogenesis protein PilX N-terminal domain-containing protein n=1 Tax=Mesoterricola silvestris TaxID=2927979 RepID=A0AA48K8W6_9BACT|nr:hypothetical protein [Mesoterricola silvestris]BDU73369.1 hypothetical protein METEAL_25430 [Mesoterricola silvestris]